MVTSYTAPYATPIFQINIPGNAGNVVADGGVLVNTSTSSTTPVTTKILDNHACRRERTTIYCLSTGVGGTLVINDIDEYGNVSAHGSSVSVTSGTLSVTTFNDVTLQTQCVFTPSSGTASNLIIRGYTGGYGAKSQ